MPAVVLQKEQGDALKLDPDGINARVKANESLDETIQDLADAAAGGYVMMYGLDLANGGHLALLLSEHMKFGVAALMEKGYLPKKLPKKSKTKVDDDHPGQYM